MFARKRAKLLFYLVLIGVFVGWPLLQLVDMIESRSDPYEPRKLLYQVSLFQLELLNNQLQESSRAASADDLNLLRQTAYSASFTHQRFALSMKDNGVAELASVNELLQYILRLQIGGSRALSGGETKVFAQAAAQFGPLYEAYKQLLDADGSVESSKNETLSKLDKELYHLFHNKLLE